MAGVQVDEATISINHGCITTDGRLRYDIWIDLPDGVTDLQSQDENEDLFPPDVVEWAYQNDYEISLLAMQLGEQVLIEE